MTITCFMQITSISSQTKIWMELHLKNDIDDRLLSNQSHIEWEFKLGVGVYCIHSLC